MNNFPSKPRTSLTLIAALVVTLLLATAVWGEEVMQARPDANESGLEIAHVWCETEAKDPGTDAVVFEYETDDGGKATIVIACRDILRHFEENQQ